MGGARSKREEQGQAHTIGGKAAREGKGRGKGERGIQEIRK